MSRSHYFKDTTSSSPTEGLFQCPGYLEFYRARRTSLRKISRLHMCILCGLKIPTMLSLRTDQFPKSLAEIALHSRRASHMTHTCTPVSLFHHSSFFEARKDFCLASEGTDSEGLVQPRKRPLHWETPTVCRRMHGNAGEQNISDLPTDRIIPDLPPFTYVGVDYFGPLEVKRGRSIVKRYGVIFTCLTTRAVHLEVAHSLDTDSCINACRRFISRRGQVLEMRSDNGTNSVATER